MKNSVKIINKKAKYEYILNDSYISGIVLTGSEIKSIRNSKVSIRESFCKFTNETRNAIEDASQNSGQTYIAAVEGVCAGGGYELALATEHIILVDDGSSSVSLPEVALLAVLPGTGGITRVTDKRMVRRDRADIFCSTEAGVRGARALEWNLVDDIVSTTKVNQLVEQRACEIAIRSDRPNDQKGIMLNPLKLKMENKSKTSIYATQRTFKYTIARTPMRK